MTNPRKILLMGALIGLAACSSSGAGGDGGGSAAPVPPSTAPAARLALFTTPQSVSGFEVTPFLDPVAVNGSVTEDSLSFRALSLTSPDFDGEEGLFDRYSDFEKSNVRHVTTPWGTTFEEYDGKQTVSRLLRAGELGSSYEYASYGHWQISNTERRFNPIGPETTIGSTHEGYSAFGIQKGNIPTTGSASYSGVWDARFFADGGYAGQMDGSTSLTADFAAQTIAGDLLVTTSSFTRANSQIASIHLNASFGAGPIIGQASTSMTYNGVPIDLSGDVNGEFYGPSAAEIAGVFRITTQDSLRTIVGGFAAKQ